VRGPVEGPRHATPGVLDWRRERVLHLPPFKCNQPVQSLLICRSNPCFRVWICASRRDSLASPRAAFR